MMNEDDKFFEDMKIVKELTDKLSKVCDKETEIFIQNKSAKINKTFLTLEIANFYMQQIKMLVNALKKNEEMPIIINIKAVLHLLINHIDKIEITNEEDFKYAKIAEDMLKETIKNGAEL